MLLHTLNYEQSCYCVLGEVPQDTKDWANSEGSADLDERSGEESEEEGGRSRQEALIH
jgi:hypothetical protein